MTTRLDFNKANTPEAALITLREVAEEFDMSGHSLNSFGQNGKPWLIIASELDKARTRIERRLIQAGYPLKLEG